MPKISESQGPSYEGVIPEHDAEIREDGSRLEVQPQIRPGEANGPSEGDGAYAGFTGAQLTAELGKRDLPKAGTKPEQVARLEAHDAETASKEAAAANDADLRGEQGPAEKHAEDGTPEVSDPETASTKAATPAKTTPAKSTAKKS